MNKNVNDLTTAVYVLNHIEVSGKQNLLNLGGAIDLIEGVIKVLSVPDQEKSEKAAELS